MTGYHVTTPAKVERYEATGAILPPVRFWPNLLTAQQWARKTHRTVILQFECETAYPMPDHKPAYWTPEVVRNYARIDRDSTVISVMQPRAGLHLLTFPLPLRRWQPQIPLPHFLPPDDEPDLLPGEDSHDRA